MGASFELKDKIERISNLPTLPQVASGLLEAVNDPETSAADVAALISQDISLSAKVMRLANSAYYGTPRSIATVQGAVVRLGFKIINTMVLSLTVFDMFQSGRHSVHFDRRAFWRHCVRCGLLARLIAEAGGHGRVEREEAFCAGLLHDIGKVVMEQYLHEDFCTALDRAHDLGVSFYDAELGALEYTHTDVSAWLISRWELPDALHFPIVSHHSPENVAACERITHVCHLADNLCYASDIAGRDQGTQPTLNPSTLDTLGIDEAGVASTIQLFATEIEKMGTFFEILDS